MAKREESMVTIPAAKSQVAPRKDKEVTGLQTVFFQLARKPERRKRRRKG
jgi:hypothetical protein